MGGVFSSPKVEAAPVVYTSSKDRDAAEEKARREAQERQRRGLESNIKTSYRGILKNDDNALQRKKLLGE